MEQLQKIAANPFQLELQGFDDGFAGKAPMSTSQSYLRGHASGECRREVVLFHGGTKVYAAQVAEGR